MCYSTMLLVKLSVNSGLFIVKFCGSQNLYTDFSTLWGLGIPSHHVVQGSPIDSTTAKYSSSNVLSFIQIQIALRYYLNMSFVYFTNKTVTFVMILSYIYVFPLSITSESTLFFSFKLWETD